MLDKWVWTIKNNEEIENRADKSILKAIQKKQGSFFVSNKNHHRELSISRNQLLKLFEENKITLNKKIIKPTSKLKPGDTVELLLNEPQSLELIPEDLPIQILYEDKDIIVINKPPGLSVHPSLSEKKGTLVHRLLFHLKDLSGIGGVYRPGIVHRIDKFTSGSLLIAKNDLAHQDLSKQFSLHTVKRKYLALVYGEFNYLKKKIETQIGRNPHHRKKMAVLNKEGKKSISHFTKKEVFINEKQKIFFTLIDAELFTGRTHQIRVHLSHLGFPLVGDSLYCSISKKNSRWINIPEEVQPLCENLPGQALHAYFLSFQHPRTKETLSINAPFFPQYETILKALQSYKHDPKK